MSVSRVDWAKAFCKWAGFPHGDDKRGHHNLWALVAWEAAEGGADGTQQARWNPLNTTWRLPGSVDFNWVGVQSYRSQEDGLNATLLTLRQPDPYLAFAPIYNHLLRGDRAALTLSSVEASAWGTGGLALRILADVKSHWRFYADRPIGQG